MKLIAAFAPLAGLAILAGCANNNTNNSGNTASSSKPAAAAATAIPKAAKGPLAFGQSAKIGDLQVTANGARIIPPGQFDAPKDGNQWVAVDFTAQNTASKPYNLSTLLQLSMFDKDSRKYGVTITTEQTNGSLDGTIPANGQVRGEVVFEVPVAGAPYTVQFTQPLGTENGVWAVTLPQ